MRIGYGVRDGFADRSAPTLRWASCLDLDQSIGSTARRYLRLAEEIGRSLKAYVAREVYRTLAPLGPEAA